MVQNSSEKHKIIPIGVIIATSYKRTELLINRALKSVLEQSITPSFVIIIDDNTDTNEFDLINRQLACLQNKNKYNGTNVFLIRNNRTKNMSGTGAWNSGVDFYLKKGINAKEFFIALLDDDDEWQPTYLEECWSCIVRNDIKKTSAVFANIRRIESNYSLIFKLKKQNLTIERFLLGNPGVQGSNMLFKLSKFLETGGFDENLASTTDRDFMISFLKVCPLSEIVLVNKTLINHYTSNYTVTSIEAIKAKGLDKFYIKHLRLFDQDLLEKSIKRAEKLFNYTNRANILDLFKKQK